MKTIGPWALDDVLDPWARRDPMASEHDVLFKKFSRLVTSVNEYAAGRADLLENLIAEARALPDSYAEFMAKIARRGAA